MPLLLAEEAKGVAVNPVLRIESSNINFLYIRHNNLYLVGISRQNSSAATILLFLARLRDVFCEYFKALEEESIRDNFVIIYELLDEMMDFGYPQTTDGGILKEFITQESHRYLFPLD
jgi:AP-1 complex subunit mu